MFALKIPVTSSTSEAIKADLTRTLPDVKSSHRCEAFARGLGFGSHAALRAQIRSPSSISVTADGVGFATYLQAHGFNVSPVPFYRAAARVALHAVLDKEPKLTIWGIGVGGPKRKANGQRENPREFQARFVAEREQLD